MELWQQTAMQTGGRRTVSDGRWVAPCRRVLALRVSCGLSSSSLLLCLHCARAPLASSTKHQSSELYSQHMHGRRHRRSFFSTALRCQQVRVEESGRAHEGGATGHCARGGLAARLRCARDDLCSHGASSTLLDADPLPDATLNGVHPSSAHSLASYSAAHAC